MRYNPIVTPVIYLGPHRAGTLTPDLTERQIKNEDTSSFLELEQVIMKICQRQVTLAVFLIVVAVLFSSCVGATGGSSSNPPAASTLVSGVVVGNGPAVTNASVVITDSLGAQKTTTTASDGSYSIDVSSLTAPFVLTATGNVGSAAVTLWSVDDVVTASTTNTVNITPWTTAIAAALSSTVCFAAAITGLSL